MLARLKSVSGFIAVSILAVGVAAAMPRVQADATGPAAVGSRNPSVSLFAMPHPGTVAVMGLGLTGLSWFGSPRRRGGSAHSRSCTRSATVRWAEARAPSQEGSTR
jgi:hypothetical protein